MGRVRGVVYVRETESKGTRYKSVLEDEACDGSGGPGCVWRAGDQLDVS